MMYVLYTSMCPKYNILSTLMKSKSYNPKEKVRWFINLESILNLISLSPDIGYKSIYQPDKIVKMSLECAINIIAHFSHFNSGDNYEIILYYTSLHCEINNKINNYRLSYKNKYLKDPKLSSFGKLFEEEILPKLKNIINDCSTVHLIESSSFDSFLIPYIINKESSENYQNFICTMDMFDCIYSIYDGFNIIYTKREYKKDKKMFDIESVIRHFIPNFNDQLFSKEYNNGVYDSVNKGFTDFNIKCLIALHGSRIRNIRGIKMYKQFFDRISEIFENETIPKYSELDCYYQDIIPRILTKQNYDNDFALSYNALDLEYYYNMIRNVHGIRLCKKDSLIHTKFDNLTNYFSNQDVHFTWLK